MNVSDLDLEIEKSEQETKDSPWFLLDRFCPSWPQYSALMLEHLIYKNPQREFVVFHLGMKTA